jgi:hypothetical protein
MATTWVSVPWHPEPLGRSNHRCGTRFDGVETGTGFAVSRAHGDGEDTGRGGGRGRAARAKGVAGRLTCAGRRPRLPSRVLQPRPKGDPGLCLRQAEQAGV